jgi:hypothetical protein
VQDEVIAKTVPFLSGEPEGCTPGSATFEIFSKPALSAVNFASHESRGLFGRKRLYKIPFGLSFQGNTESFTSGCFGVPVANRQIS